MLIKRHPKKRNIPPLQLSLQQFRELCDKTLGNLGPDTSYEIKFQGLDGSEITSDVSALSGPIDDTVPDLITMPLVDAHSSSGNSVEMRNEVVSGPDNPTKNTYYILVVTVTSQVWAEGVAEATMQWFRRKQSPLFRYYYFVSVGLPVMALLCFILALGFSVHEDANQNLHFGVFALPLGLPLIIAALAFAMASRLFNKRYPRFSVVVRPPSGAKTWLTVAGVLAALASAVTIVQGIIAVIRR